MPRRVMRLAERDEDGDARLGPHLARDVALTGEVLRDQDVAGAQPAHGAVADLDVDRAAEREHRRPSRRVVPRIAALRIELPDDDAAAGNQLPAVGLITARCEARRDLLEVRFPVRARVDADDGHGTSGSWCHACPCASGAAPTPAPSTLVSPSRPSKSSRGSSGMNTRTSAVVAALSHTRSANAQPRLSRSHEPITSEPFIAKFRALIMIASPRPSQPRGHARTARSINASSEQITTRQPSRWITGGERPEYAKYESVNTAFAAMAVPRSRRRL